MTTTKSNPIQTVQPYLNFEGRCEEAIEFYRSALGAEVIMLMRFKDSPEPGMCAPGAENKVLHASLRIGETTLMASDGRCQGKLSFQGFSLSLAVLNESEAERLFASVAEGGQVGDDFAPEGSGRAGDQDFHRFMIPCVAGCCGMVRSAIVDASDASRLI